MKEYAVYKNEEILAIGNVKEIAEKLKVKERTVYFWSTPTQHKRNKRNAKIAIKIDLEEENQC